MTAPVARRMQLQAMMIITSDTLNAQVDAHVKVKSDKDGLKSSQYNVFDYKVE